VVIEELIALANTIIILRQLTSMAGPTGHAAAHR